MALGVVVVLLGGIAGGGLWAWDTYGDKIRDVMGWGDSTDYEDGIATGSVTVTIVSGDTGATISESLYEAGVTKTSSAFYDYLISTAQNPTFQPGVYQLQQQMSSAAALTALMDSANKLTDTVVIPEGLGYEDALQRVADATGLSYDDLLAEAADYTQFGVPAEAPSIEGFLFPATYTFDPDVTAYDAIARMVDEMFSRLDALGVAESDRLEVLTLASIVQKEAGSTDDMPKIARVFLNRIADGMPLQSDATVAYGAGLTGTVWTTEEEREDTSNIYNTYVITGLPPGPISLPGEDAIDAALNPADGSWLYFVAVNLQTGETVFSDTYEEHEAAVAEMQAWCAESENAAYCQ
ncbi:MAG: endolytic transglycosylase MltG [Microbacterium sp.]